MLSPRQIFEDNIRPADLLLKVYRCRGYRGSRRRLMLMGVCD